MEKRIFMAGKRVQVFSGASAFVWAVFSILMGLYRGWSPFLLLPAVLALVYSFLFIRSRRKPLFLLSGEEFVIARKGTKIPLAGIREMRDTGKDRFELVFHAREPVQVFIHEMSAEDQSMLKDLLRDIIEGKKTTQT